MTTRRKRTPWILTKRNKQAIETVVIHLITDH
jgi:hypothetical protein